MSANAIPIDLELHKLIEANRRTLDELQVEIVRRVLRENLTPDKPQIELPAAKTGRRSRAGGIYEFKLLGNNYSEGSLKSVLKTVILAIADRQPEFVEQLSRYRTQRGRHIVAKTPHEIYPGRPQLVEQGYAEQLNKIWWFDTNISRDGCKRYLLTICEIAGLNFGGDLELDF
jgi:hypothetical protein